MSISCEEKALWTRLRQINPDVVEDGVVDENEYLSAKYRIVYVLKEVNGGKSWNLKEFLRLGGRTATWDNVARWTEAILHLDQPHNWDYWEKNCEQRRKEYLKKIGAVNLKKISGGHTSIGKEVYGAAVQNKDFLKQQIDLYRPDIVICCGTTTAFVDAVYSDTPIAWEMTSRGIWYFMDGNRVVVSYLHPEVRTKNCITHYALVDAIKEIMETEK